MGGENGDPAAEPHENDTMLDDSGEPTKRRPGRLSAAAAALGLPPRWLLALAVLALLAVLLLVAVVALAASWPPPPPVDDSVRCETADCLRAAAQLQSSLAGGDAAACDSFWDHTCSVWLRRNPIPQTQSQWGVTEQLLYSAEQRLQRILSTLPHVDSSHSYKWKLNAFYQGCMGRASQPEVSELNNKLRTIINNLGGFDAIGSFVRPVWDPRSVVRKLQADHNIDVFFRISIVPDPDGKRNVIQISSGGVGLPERGYYFRDHDDQVVTAYQRYIQDVLLRMGATTDRASRFAQSMFNYEKRLVETSLEPLALRDPARSPRRVTVDWLRKESPQIDWLNTLRSVYPNGKVNMDTEILLPDDVYIVELSKIISTTDTSSMNGYLMWRLVAGYYPYLPEVDRAVLDVLRSELTGVVQKPPHWLTCTRITREFFPLATGALLARAEPREARLRRQQAVQDMFRALTQSLAGAVTYSRFIDDQSRAGAIHQVSSVRLFAGYPSLLLDDKLLDSIYSELNVLRFNFFDSVQAARRHQRVVEQKAYVAPGQQWELEPLLNGATVAYSRSRNAVVVPDQLLRPPLFDPAYPPPFQYGGLGTRLATAVLSSIGPSSLATADAADSNSTDGGRTMAHNQRTFRTCVSAALRAAGVQEQTVPRVAGASARQVLGVRLALQTLKNHLEEVGHEQLPGLETVSDEKIFFIAYGQSLCKEKTEEKDHWDEFSTFSLDGKPKLHLTVEQAAPFREAFQCNATHAHVITGPCGGFV